MRHNSHQILEYCIRIPLAFVELAASIVFTVSGVRLLAQGPGLLMGAAAVLSILSGGTTLASCYYSVLNLTAYVWLDEHGMYKKRFSKTLIALPWEQIRFAAPGIKDSYRGPQKRFCFAPRVLSIDELAELGEVDRECIYFAKLTRQELEFIRKHCPVEIGSSVEAFVKR